MIRYGTIIPKLEILPFILFFFDFIFIFIAYHILQEEIHFLKAGKDGCIMFMKGGNHNPNKQTKNTKLEKTKNDRSGYAAIFTGGCIYDMYI